MCVLHTVNSGALLHSSVVACGQYFAINNNCCAYRYPTLRQSFFRRGNRCLHKFNISCADCGHVVGHVARVM